MVSAASGCGNPPCVRFPCSPLFVVIFVPLTWNTGCLHNLHTLLLQEPAGGWVRQITQCPPPWPLTSPRTSSSRTAFAEVPSALGTPSPSLWLSGVVLLLGSFSVGPRKAPQLPCPLRAPKQAPVPFHAKAPPPAPYISFHQLSFLCHSSSFKNKTKLPYSLVEV